MCKLTKSRLSTLSLLVSFVVLAYGIVLIGLSALAYVRYQDTLDFIGVVENWSYSPILDLQIKGVDEQCDFVKKNDDDSERQFFRSNNVFNFPWKGFSSGCDCTTTTVRDVKKGGLGSCESTCQQVKDDSSSEDQWLTVWSHLANDFKLCIKRFEGVNFYNSHIKKAGECPSPGMQIYGGPDPEKQFCVPVAPGKGPVTSISFSSDAQNTESTTNGITTVYYGRAAPDTNPLSEFTIQQGSGVCGNVYFLNYPSLFEPYPLSEQKYFRCSGQGTDPNWNSVATVQAQNFFSANKRTEITPTKVPGFFVEGGDSPFTLYQRSYVQWNINCRQDFKEFVDAILKFFVMVQIQTAIIVFSAGFSFLLAILCVIQICSRFSKKFCCCFKIRCFRCCRTRWAKKEKQEKCTDYCTLYEPLFVILLSFKWLAEFLVFALSTAVIAYSNSVAKQTEKYLPMNCTDPFTQKSLETFNHQTADVIPTANKAITGLTVPGLIIQTALFIIVWRYTTNEKRKAQIRQINQLGLNELNSQHSIVTYDDEQIQDPSKQIEMAKQ